MATLLSKGGNVALQVGDEVPDRVEVVVRWSDPRAAAEVDVSALILGPDEKVRGDEDLVFYNAPSALDGAVRILGRRSGDDGAAEDRIAVDLQALPEHVGAVAITASLDSEPGVRFGDLHEVSLTVATPDGIDLVRFDVLDAGTETAFVLGRIYRRDGQWKCRAVGQGWDTGLAGLARDFGIAVQDDAASVEAEDSPEPGPNVDGPDGVIDLVAETEAEDEEVAAAPPAVIDVPTDDAAPVVATDLNPAIPDAELNGDQLSAAVPVVAPSAAVARTARRNGQAIRTAGARPRPSALPVLTLAGDSTGRPRACSPSPAPDPRRSRRNGPPRRCCPPP